jgi:hypothetical protein
MPHIAAESLFAALNAGASSLDEQIFLVSKCGKKFGISAKRAKASSGYFVGLMDSGMAESGKLFLHLFPSGCTMCVMCDMKIIYIFFWRILLSPKSLG